MIIWAMSLLPALLILGWSLRQARLPKTDFVSAGLTAEEAQRLKRILKEPQEDAVPRLQDDSVRVVTALEEPRSGAGEPAPQAGSDARLDKSILSMIKDNTFGIMAAEKPAYDAILSKLRSESLAELESIAHGDLPFAVLMLAPDRYRGEIVTLEGDVRRINKLPESFEAWLFTAESGLNPYRIVFPSLPDGVPLGDDLTPPIRVRVTGYFFKRFSYATANDFHTAPLLLAKTLTPLARHNPVAVPPTKNSRSLTFLAIGILVTFVIGGLTVEMIARRRSRRRECSPEETPDSPPDFSWLKRP